MIKRSVYFISIAISSLITASDFEHYLVGSSEISQTTNYYSNIPVDRSNKIKILTEIEQAMQKNDYEKLVSLLRVYSCFTGEAQSELGDLFFWSCCDEKETELLIKAGANVNYKKSFRGCAECKLDVCPYHVRSPLLYKLCKGSIQEAIHLIKYGASLYSRDYLGRTPVHMAVLLTRINDDIEPIYTFLYNAQIRNPDVPILLWLKDNKGQCAMDILYEDEKAIFSGSSKWPIIDENIKQEFGSIRDLIRKIKENPIFKLPKQHSSFV